MDHAQIVDQLMQHCKQVIDKILHAPDLQGIAAASLAIFERMRELAHALLQAKIDLEAQRLKNQAPEPCCPGATMAFVHTRLVQPTTLFGQVDVPVRTFRCMGCGTTVRPDDAPLGLPSSGEFTDDVRALYTPLAAELPHRVSNEIFARFTGVELSSHGAQGLIERSATDLGHWQATQEAQQRQAVAVARQEDASRGRLEIAMDGVMAHIDGRWQEAKVATVVVRRLPRHSPRPVRGAVLARRYVCVLGSAEELVERIKQTIRQAGWEAIPVAEILGDGAAWIWTVAEAHFPGVRQTLDYYHLSEHFYDVARLLYPEQPEAAKAWVEAKLAACVQDRVGDVLGALRRLRPRPPAARQAVRQLIGYVENNRHRICYKAPWYQGLAVGSGAVEGACKHVIQARFKRAGMRWKRQGFLQVLALRLARLNNTLDAFWASRGLPVQAAA
ncbi:MAG: hypothetical protein KatS3mg131_2321 [Candidatus Tectimicrobiota bacterium]|nr:MAG: hypothetical protein KatS3mg131_2321 [Candidatus Tectomicrobia bacterium]